MSLSHIFENHINIYLFYILRFFLFTFFFPLSDFIYFISNFIHSPFLVLLVFSGFKISSGFKDFMSLMVFVCFLKVFPKELYRNLFCSIISLD